MNKNEVNAHYKLQAKKFGTSGRSTINDQNVRDLEIKCLLNYLPHNGHVLEVGGGNGYTAKEIVANNDIDLKVIDFCEDQIKAAKEQLLPRKIDFEVGDVLNLQFTDNTFDAVYTERCLINLTSWEDQKQAISEIHRALKTGGLFIMMEAFTDGLDVMNNVRNEFGLNSIPQPSYDIFFEKAKLFEFVNGKFAILQDDNFLSTYYFGSRILYPLLLSLTSKMEPKDTSKFTEFFKLLPPIGHYSSIEAIVLKKC